MRRALPVLFTLLLLSCSREKERPQLTSAQTGGADDQLAVQIDQRLGKEPGLSIAARGVEVSVDGGVAALRGKVSSAQVREAVHAVVERTPGVTGLSDELVVAPEGPSDAESDRIITGAALRALRADPSLLGLVADLDLSSKHGIVMIKRDKLTGAQDRAVTTLLEGLPGVIVVTDKGVVGH
jgi:hypothetical protein